MFAGLLAFSGCTSLVLTPVDYSWLVESRLTTNSDGLIQGEPRSFQCNMKGLFLEEQGRDGQANWANRTVNIIRDREGYYYITSSGFKHVYVFKSSAGELVLINKVQISTGGMDSPYFNFRAEGIELNDSGQEFLLNKSGRIAGGSR